MGCDVISLPGGERAIVCGSRRRQRCACGNWASLLCDWKVPAKKSGTCDAPICTRCATSPAVSKDLCRAHATAFAEWQERRAPARADGSARA
ncbi:hypothetical protein [Sphingomonas bacterium]|uniref:hypothetical protein n=1 Tax=Sphingomonas bacterium TaxID=1895847 RepID=UPI0015764FED|nr:hypothetical protein [Sphingomonas bacterium]